MDGQVRRRQIVETLKRQQGPLTGAELAQKFQVSRQVIVQDIALLRAAGTEIIATPQGYQMAENQTPGAYRKTFACVHDEQGLEEELFTIVDYGGTVVDVVVTHPFYGDLRGTLNLKSRYDVQVFLQQMKKNQAKPLLVLTRGVHLHTVEAETMEALKLIEEKLLEKGFLLR